jgi:hypothetical protein
MKYKTDPHEWIEQWKKDHFSDLPSDSLAKRLLSYSNKRTKQILNLTKTEIKTLTGILTGHCGLRYHMHRIEKDLEDTCQYVMCECPALARIRLEWFGKGFMSPQTVKSLYPKSILGFLKSVQLEEIYQFGLFSKRSC